MRPRLARADRDQAMVRNRHRHQLHRPVLLDIRDCKFQHVAYQFHLHRNPDPDSGKIKFVAHRIFAPGAEAHLGSVIGAVDGDLVQHFVLTKQRGSSGFPPIVHNLRKGGVRAHP